MRTALILMMLLVTLALAQQPAQGEGQKAGPGTPDLSDYSREDLVLVCQQLYRRIAELEQQVNNLEAALRDEKRGGDRRQPAGKAGQPPRAEADRFDQQRKNRLREVRKELRELQGKEDGPQTYSIDGTVFGSFETKEEATKRLRNEMRAIKAGDWLPKIDPDKIGSIGAISDAWRASHGMRMERIRGNRLQGTQRTGEVEVTQVVNDQAAIVEVFGTTAWVEGIDTSGMVDDRKTTLRGLYEVTGTERYETVGGGSRTIFKIEPLDERRPTANRSKSVP